MATGATAAGQVAIVSLGANATLQPLELPVPTDWLHWGISDLAELHAGQQSRCFSAVLDENRVVVKLTDQRLTDTAILRSRMAAVESLGAELSQVVAPVRIRGALVQPIGEWLMTATPLIAGDHLDISTPDAANLMGITLARLHPVLATLPVLDIPPIAALASSRCGSAQPGWQLLHGDFSNKNLIAGPKGLRILDFDDCGYGPIEYDLANSLYMVMFDGEVTGSAIRFETFRSSFLDGYDQATFRSVDEAAVDAMIELRIAALDRWLDDLPNAPIGIRTSSPEWLATLRSFVTSNQRRHTLE